MSGGDKKQLQSARKKKVLQPKISCFVSCEGKTSNNSEFRSPEYKMSSERKTRHSSRREQQGKQQPNSRPDKGIAPEEDEVSSDDHKVDQEEVIHSGVLPCPEEMDPRELKKISADGQMEVFMETINSLCRKITEVDILLNHDTDGLSTRMGSLQIQADNSTVSLNKLGNLPGKYDHIEKQFDKLTKQQEEMGKDVSELKQDRDVIKGILQRHSKKLESMNERVAMLTVRSKEKNITISNLMGDGKEKKCVDTVVQFLRNQVEIDAADEEILVAHRIGKITKDTKSGKVTRLMLVHCTPDLKTRIFKNVANLKGKIGENGKPFYVNKQLPEFIVEQNRQNWDIIAKKKEKEKHLASNKKTEIKTQSGKVYFDGKPAPDFLPQVHANELFPDSFERRKQSEISYAASDIISDRESSFQAYAVHISNLPEVRRAYYRLKIMHSSADHVAAVYVNKKHTGYQDDGEYGAAHKLLRQMQEEFVDVKSIAVFLVRYAGIQKLGPDRFDHFKTCASQALRRLKDM